jgi:hypothetical protein
MNVGRGVLVDVSVCKEGSVNYVMFEPLTRGLITARLSSITQVLHQSRHAHGLAMQLSQHDRAQYGKQFPDPIL